MRIALLTFVLLAGIGVVAGNVEHKQDTRDMAQRAGVHYNVDV